MSDLISRQAAIREYQEICKGIKCGECPFLIKVNTEKGSHLITDCKLEAFLHDLPSAQPDLSEYSDKLWRNAYERGKRDAQPERKKGLWIDKSDGIEGAWNYCSVCGEQAIDLYDFCPNCGARMNGGEEND